MLLVGRPIDGVEGHGVQPFAKPTAHTSRYHGLQLAEISDHDREGLVGLLPNTDEESLPLPVVILTPLVHQKGVDTPKR